MPEEQIVIDLQIDSKQLIKENTKARKEIADLKEEQRKLRKEGEEGSEVFSENASRLKTLRKEVRDNEKVLQKNLQTQKANRGSLDQLKAQLSVLTKRYSQLSEEERENTEAGQKLARQVKETTDKLKEQESAVGNNRRNVGNYSESIQEAANESGLFGGIIERLQGAQVGLNTVTKVTTASTKSFKTALISTGIGALLVALGSLVALLKETQGGIDLVNQVLAGLKATFQVIIDRAVSFGQGIVKLFEGDMSGAVDKFKSSFQGIGQEIVEEASKAAEVEKELQRIEKAQARLKVERAKGRAEIEKLKRVAEDTTLSEQERFKASEKALKIEQKNLQKSIELQKDKIKALRERNKLDDTTEETDKQDVRDAQIELARLEEESFGKQTELNNKRNELDRKIREKEKKRREEAIEAQKEAEQEKLEKQREAQEKANENFEESVAERQETFEEGLEKELLALKRRFAEGELSQKQYQRKLENVNERALKERNRLQDEILKDIQDNENITAELRAKLQDELEAKIIQSENAILDAQIEAEKEKRKEAEKTEQKRKENAQKEKERQLQQIDRTYRVTSEIFSAFQSLNGFLNGLSNQRIQDYEEEMQRKIKAAEGNSEKQEKIEKKYNKKIAQEKLKQAKRDRTLAIFDVVLSTAQAIAKAIAEFPVTGGMPFAAIAAAQGAAQIAAITAQPLPKAEKGASFKVGGKRHSEGGTKFYGEDGTQFEAEQGEMLTVVNRNSTGLLSKLSALNEMGGGKPFGPPKPKLEDGGLVARASSPQQVRGQDLSKSISEGLSNMKIYTKVTELERVQQDRDTVVTKAEL